MKRNLLFFLILLLFLTGFACRPAPKAEPTLEIYVFSARKSDSSDALLLRGEDFAVLIDTGLKDNAKKLSERLTEIGVTRLDCVILTHFDKDHMGGAEQIAEDFEVAQVYMADYMSDGKPYRNMVAAFSAANIPFLRVSEAADIEIADLRISFTPSPLDYDGEDESDNAQSLICGVTYGESRLLFMGDANGAWLEKLCFGAYNLSCDFLKLPHHGVWNENLIWLLTVSMPNIVVVTDSDKDPADPQTVGLLDSFGMEAYYTKDGELHFRIDKKNQITYEGKD
ncbi:MAG: MBL fold metallo-hydrolase [Clostridiales bacterium]|nr:MBL fold metallo-hydrolase [Clostridiales bacterium]